MVAARTAAVVSPEATVSRTAAEVGERATQRERARCNFAAGMERMRWVWGSVFVALALLAAPLAARAAQPPTRYSLVHGCYALTAASGVLLADAAHVRMQATGLGRYLLYRQDGTFLAAQDDGSVRPA